MKDLIEKLEAATEGSRERDAEIAIAVRWLKAASGQPIPEWADTNFPRWRARADGHVECVRSDGTPSAHWEPPHFSRSLDAAMSLVPNEWWIEKLCEMRTSIIYKGDAHESVGSWQACLQHRLGGRHINEHAANLPIALVIAALKARA